MNATGPYTVPVAGDPDVVRDIDCDGLSPNLVVLHIPIDLTAVDVRDEHGHRIGVLRPFTDTPGPKGDGSKSGVQVEVPAEGWPEGWRPSMHADTRSAYIGGNHCTVPNTEPGRIAAWVLEGK